LLYKDLRGDGVFGQGILREYFLTLRRRAYAIDGARLPDGIFGLRHAVGSIISTRGTLRAWPF
jgi:hypothetical protein